MADLLPQEVLIDILVRLTIEDLVVFITVSKSWYSLITSPDFISFHIKRTSANNNSLLLIREHNYDDDYSDESKIHRENYSLRFDNDTFEVYKSLDFPFISGSWNPSFRVIGCLNGVVCLSDDLICYMDVIILWNPSIKKSLTLPEPLVTYSSHGSFQHVIGFGFSTVTNDYKVVRVVHLLDYKEDLIPPVVEVYDLSVGYWRIIDSKDFNYVLDERSSQAFLNGTIHWVGYKLGDSNSEFFNMIVSFDLENEVLGVMKLLDTMIARRWPRGPRFYVLSVLGGSLSLIKHDLSRDASQSCIWVMNQYGVNDSWTKLFTIDLAGSLRRVFGYRNNGEALLSVRRPYEGTAMVSYDPNSKQLKYLEELQSDDRSFNVESFVESLSLLGVKGEQMMGAADNTAARNGSPDVHMNKKRKKKTKKRGKKNKRAYQGKLSKSALLRL